MKTLVKKLLKEAIKAHEAHGDVSSIQTIIDRKRNVGFINSKDEGIINMIKSNRLSILNVPSNKYGSYIVYRQGADDDAIELRNIAEKYGGFLSSTATEEDSIRIGQLLGYEESDIKDYIIHNRKLRQKNNKI